MFQHRKKAAKEKQTTRKNIFQTACYIALKSCAFFFFVSSHCFHTLQQFAACMCHRFNAVSWDWRKFLEENLSKTAATQLGQYKQKLSAEILLYALRCYCLHIDIISSSLLVACWTFPGTKYIRFNCVYMLTVKLKPKMQQERTRLSEHKQKMANYWKFAKGNYTKKIIINTRREGEALLVLVSFSKKVCCTYTHCGRL